MAVLTPKPRGRLSEAVIDHLRGRGPLPDRPVEIADHDEDLQLALWTAYELTYRGFEDVDDAMEWDPELLRVRRELEQVFEAELRERCEQPATSDVVTALFAIAESDDGPSLAHVVQRRATREQVLQLLRIRSVYHLKEADPMMPV